jgi:hypothetical protein
MIRAGATFNPDPSYAEALAKKKWVAYVEVDEPAKKKDPGPGAKPPPSPDKNRSKPPAPNRAGKGQAGGITNASIRKSAKGTASGTGRPLAVGKVATSRSLRADLPSSAKTSSESDDGEKNLETPPTEETGPKSDPPPAE